MSTTDSSHSLSPLRGLPSRGVFYLRACARSYLLLSLRDGARAAAMERFHIQYSFVILVVISSLSSLSQAASQQARLGEKHRVFFETHCLDCHDSATREGKVDLESLAFEITTLEQAELWQKVLNSLNAGEMPPEDAEQPGNNEKADFLEDLARTMVAARKTLSDSGGKITMRRLNRREYRNTVEQLTGAWVDVSNLPADSGSGTFDTVGSSLFISSDQFEQYLKIGRAAIDEAFQRQAARETGSKVFRVEPETTVNVQSLERIRALEDIQERFLAWKAGVDKAIAAFENREVVARILKENKKIRLAEPEASGYKFYTYAHELNGAPDPNDFGFRDDNKAVFSYQGGYQRTYALLKHYAALPFSDRGTYLKTAWGIQRIDISPNPKDLPPGTYTLRVRTGTVDGSDPSRHFIEVGHPQRVNAVPYGFAGLPISGHQVTGTIDNPEIIETTIKIGTHTQREFGIQEKLPTNTKARRNIHNAHKRENGYGTPPAIWIDWLELEGPLAPSQIESNLAKILSDHSGVASETDRALRMLKDFCMGAFRGVSPDPRFVDQLLALYQTRRDAGEQFDVAIRLPLSVILASPGFLYLNEPGGKTGVKTESRTITDRELAVRLSYFLWSSPPDATLLKLAVANKLHKPETLRQQVDRLIADPRSDNFVAGFVHQWMDMERLDFFQFDVNLYPDFDESTRAATREEVYHSFAHLLRANGNRKRERGSKVPEITRPSVGSPGQATSNKGRIGKLLQSDYVFVNGLLATYYGLEGVTGDHFRKIKLPKDSPRGGLLGMAAIHAMGSDGVVSSPVERGAWVLRYLLNDPPPPAPPNVPQLSRLNDQVLTTRERLLSHQEEAQCASCHRKIDPIGFGLENWDAAGKWRTTDHAGGKGKNGKTWAIDASGAFHKGPEFNDYNALRDLIANREEDFARGFTEHLIEYALGRPFGFRDEELADDIVRTARSKEFAVSEFIHAVVQSEAFRIK